MSRLLAVALVVLAASGLASCKDVPGADGRYATHDQGRNNRP